MSDKFPCIQLFEMLLNAERIHLKLILLWRVQIPRGIRLLYSSQHGNFTFIKMENPLFLVQCIAKRSFDLKCHAPYAPQFLGSVGIDEGILQF